MGELGQRLADAVLEPISDHPLRVAAGTGALLAAAVMWVNVAASADAATAGQDMLTATAIDTVGAYAADHPAYPIATVVGLAVALFAR